MHIVVLTSPDSWYFKDLRRAAKELGLQLSTASFSQLAANVGQPNLARQKIGPYDVQDVDAVLIRSMPPGSLEQVVFRMNFLSQLEELSIRIINSPRSMEIAIDKYLCLAKLDAGGVTVPESFVCQTAEQAMVGFESLGRNVVVKPVFGGEGRGIMQVEDSDLAWRAFKTIERTGGVIYLQEFVHHNGSDTRILRVGSEWHAIKRSNPHDWRTNLRRGAVAVPITPTPEQVEMAQRAMQLCGCEIAGVDMIADPQGRNYVVEVNAVPGWRGLARTLNVDIASQMLQQLIRLVDA